MGDKAHWTTKPIRAFRVPLFAPFVFPFSRLSCSNLLTLPAASPGPASRCWIPLQPYNLTLITALHFSTALLSSGALISSADDWSLVTGY